jgi:hypothetical protein
MSSETPSRRRDASERATTKSDKRSRYHQEICYRLSHLLLLERCTLMSVQLSYANANDKSCHDGTAVFLNETSKVCRRWWCPVDEWAWSCSWKVARGSSAKTVWGKEKPDMYQARYGQRFCWPHAVDACAAVPRCTWTGRQTAAMIRYCA